MLLTEFPGGPGTPGGPLGPVGPYVHTQRRLRNAFLLYLVLCKPVDLCCRVVLLFPPALSGPAHQKQPCQWCTYYALCVLQDCVALTVFPGGPGGPGGPDGPWKKQEKKKRIVESVTRAL